MSPACSGLSGNQLIVWNLEYVCLGGETSVFVTAAMTLSPLVTYAY